MSLLLKIQGVGLAVLLAAVPGLSAETKVNVQGVHFCCANCVKAVDAALAQVEGVKHEVDQKRQSVSIVAPDVPSAQKAIDAMAAAGFHGKLDNKAVHFPPVDAPKGKVTRLELTGFHNCCGGCTKAIKGAIAKVPGVEADTAKPKQQSVVVEGNFNAAEVIQALADAGFHARVAR